MNKCLVTKLSGKCSNTELLRVGEVRIAFKKVDKPTKGNQAIDLNVNKPVILEIIGDGSFTDSSLNVNKGKQLSYNVTDSTVFVSNDNLEIAILDKYSIVTLKPYYYTGIVSEKEDFGNKSICIDDYSYSTNLNILYLTGIQVTGNIDSLKNLTSLTSISLNATQVIGNIDSLKNLTALKSLQLGNTQVIGNIDSLKNLTALTSFILSKTQITGNIDSLKNLTSLTSISLNDTKITGNIDSLKNLTSLTSISLNDTKITGNIDSLKNLTSLATIILKQCTFKGDLALVPASCRFASFQENINTSFTWSTRPSTAKIIAIEGNAKILNLDKMLQDQAQCQVGYISTDPSWFKAISVVGTRTSASDAAISTLQSKGYTVTITPK